MTRVERLLRLAYKASYQASEECAYPIGAVLAKGGRVLSLGANSSKTHPVSPNSQGLSPKRQTHAEVSCCLHSGHRFIKDFEDCTLYVARRKANGNIGLAKPCKFCQRFLKQIGLRHVWYTDNNGKACYLDLDA